MKHRTPFLTFILAVLLLLPATGHAADLLIAQAANFMPAMEEIIPAFKKATGIEVQASYASTGKLYSQITNKAPFDIFLAADEKRPAKLFADGLAQEPFVYARGQIVLWSLDKANCKADWKSVLLSPGVKKIGIANTETAPYGTAAMKAMQAENVWQDVQSKLVYGQSISQVFHFAVTGSADVGFCAYSSVFTDEGKKGCFTVIEKAPLVIQSACVLKDAVHADAATKFVQFLDSPEVQAIKNKYGYK